MTQKQKLLVAPRISFDIIQRVRYFPVKNKEIAINVLKNNAYFAHPENAAMAMLYVLYEIFRSAIVS